MAKGAIAYRDNPNGTTTFDLEGGGSFTWAGPVAEERKKEIDAMAGPAMEVPGSPYDGATAGADPRRISGRSVPSAADASANTGLGAAIGSALNPTAAPAPMELRSAVTVSDQPAAPPAPRFVSVAPITPGGAETKGFSSYSVPDKPSVAASPGLGAVIRATTGVEPTGVHIPGPTTDGPAVRNMVEPDNAGGGPTAPPAPEIVMPQYSGGGGGTFVPGQLREQARTTQIQQGVPVPEEVEEALSEAEGYEQSALGHQMSAEAAKSEIEADKREQQQDAAAGFRTDERRRNARRDEELREIETGIQAVKIPENARKELPWLARALFVIAAAAGGAAGDANVSQRIDEWIEADIKAPRRLKSKMLEAQRTRTMERYTTEDERHAAEYAHRLKLIEDGVADLMMGVQDDERKAGLMRQYAVISRARATAQQELAEKRADRVTVSSQEVRTQDRVTGGSPGRWSGVREAAESYIARGGDPAKLEQHLAGLGVPKAQRSATMLSLSTPRGLPEDAAKGPDQQLWIPMAGGYASTAEDAKTLKAVGSLVGQYRDALAELAEIRKNLDVSDLAPGSAARERVDALGAELTRIVKTIANTGAAMPPDEKASLVDPITGSGALNPFVRNYDARLEAARRAADRIWSNEVTARGVSPGVQYGAPAAGGGVNVRGHRTGVAAPPGDLARAMGAAIQPGEGK